MATKLTTILVPEQIEELTLTHCGPSFLSLCLIVGRPIFLASIRRGLAKGKKGESGKVVINREGYVSLFQPFDVGVKGS